VLAADVLEKLAAPKKLLRMEIFFSVLGPLLEARGRSTVLGVLAALRSFDASSLKLAFVVAAPELEDLDEGDGVDQVDVAHRAGWKHSTEDRRLPSSLRALPIPTFVGGVAAGFAGGACRASRRASKLRRTYLYFIFVSGFICKMRG
jgi:hypothetical protein